MEKHQKLKFSILILFFLSRIIFCQTANIIKRIPLPGIPSASGIEFLNGKYYIIGDDSPWLFVLNTNFEITDRIEIFDVKQSVDGRIPKPIKPDYEAITFIKWGKDNDLLIFGSGTGEYRENAVKIDFDKDGEIHKKEFKLEKLYKELRDEADLSVQSFNIEGITQWKDYLLIMNRGMNNLFIIRTDDFKDFMKDDKKKIKIKAYNYILPSQKGNKAGFSGSCMLQDEDMLLFTASIENTPDWISDGEILGSFIGFIDLNDPLNTKPLCIPVKENGKNVLDKIESIINISKTDSYLEALAVTDNDNGRSDLLVLKINKK